MKLRLSVIAFMFVLSRIATAQNCNAGFYYTEGTSCDITFVDTSSGSIMLRMWDFGDGNVGTGQFAIHQYGTMGTYMVCLRVSGPGCYDSICTSVTVSTGCSGCAAKFTAVPGSANTVSFFDMSANAAYWSWDFGDGDTSALQSPVHIYGASGTYLACLTVYDSFYNCTNTWCDSVTAGTVTGLYTNESGPKPGISLYKDAYRDIAVMRYTVDQSGIVQITLTDLLGNEWILADGWKQKGIHHLSWGTRDISPGIYIVTLSAGSIHYALKWIHLK